MKRSIIFIILSVVVLSFIHAQGQREDVMKQIAHAQELLKNNSEEAAREFGNILKGKNKKDPEVLIAVGKAYLRNGMLPKASDLAQKVLEINNKYAPAYVLKGDIELLQKEIGNSCSNYEQAIYFDPDCKEAYLKYAQAYSAVNPSLSIEMLLKLQQRDTSYLPVQKELADIYYSMGEYGKAKIAYDIYFASDKAATKDMTNYGMVLFLAKEYESSLKIAEKMLESEPGNLLLQRLVLYNNSELKHTEKGLEAAQQFFSTFTDSDRVYLDYLYYGRLLAASGKPIEAISHYKKAISLEPSEVGIWKELSEVYEKGKQYELAVESFNHYLNANRTNPTDVSDLFLLGRLYYFAGSTQNNNADEISVYQKECLNKADSIFAMVALKAPDNYLGNFWRARTNSLLDPETTVGLAKPYYEQALSILEKKTETSKALLIECNSYLGYYYFVKNDFANSKICWNKILKIDPANETARKALAGIK